MIRISYSNHSDWCLVATCFLALALPGKMLWGATWIVNSPNDTLSRGTLRHAIVNAASGDTIRLAGGLSKRPIILTNGEIVIDKSLTITGLGNNGSIISGGKKSRVFSIASGTNVRLENLTIIDGMAPGDSGIAGGILNSGDLNLVQTNLRNHLATEQGGAVYSTGTLTVENCSFSENTAIAGGGIFSAPGAKVSIRSSSFTSNYSKYFGAGIFSWFGVLTIADSTFTENHAEEGGGAVLDFSSGVDFTNCKFINNQTGFRGGAVYIINTGGEISNCEFTGNSAFDGGGLLNMQSSIVVTNSQFTDNRSRNTGGGIACQDAYLYVSNSTLTRNFGQNASGGIESVRGSFDIEECVIQDNSSHSFSGVRGYAARFSIRNTLITGNVATYANAGGLGCLHCVGSVTGCKIIDNIAPHFPDDILLWYSEVELSDTLYGELYDGP